MKVTEVSSVSVSLRDAGELGDEEWMRYSGSGDGWPGAKWRLVVYYQVYALANPLIWRQKEEAGHHGKPR